MLPDKAKFDKCSIISLALSVWMEHLLIGSYNNLLNSRLFIGHHLEVSFHWSAFGNQQGSTFTETSRNGLFHYIGCLITLSDRNRPILDQVYSISTIFLTYFQPVLADLITESDKAVQATHSCKSWFVN